VDVFQYPLRVDPGVLLGASITLHPSRFLSHELFFGSTQANLITGRDPVAQVDRLSIRTAGYQVEANLTPARWRLRPFVSVGSSVTTYSFKNINLTKRNGIFKFALHNVGTVLNAFNSAGAAPLDGGKVFRLGLTYGGGIKCRVSRLVEFQAEYRETYAKDPDFFNKQSISLSSQGISSAQDRGARSHADYIISLSFTP
jgi:opacity protein-like surface antigen